MPRVDDGPPWSNESTSSRPHRPPLGPAQERRTRLVHTAYGRLMYEIGPPQGGFLGFRRARALGPLARILAPQPSQRRDIFADSPPTGPSMHSCGAVAFTREQSRDRGRTELSLCHAKATAQARTGAVRIEL